MASSSAPKTSGPRKTAPDQSGAILVAHYDEVFLYMDKKWLHKAIPPLPTPRYRPTASFIPRSNVIIVAGGLGDTVLSSVLIWDLSTKTWRKGPSMVEKRVAAAGVCLADGMTFIICGGVCGTQKFPSCESFDGTAWSAAGSLSTPRGDHAIVLYKDKPVVLGGNTPTITLNTAEQYDQSTNSWAPFPSFSVPRCIFGAAVVLDKIYIVGGGTCIVRSLCDERMSSVEVFDGDAWSTLSSALPSGPRSSHAVVSFQDKLVVIGGNHEKIDVYDPINNSWLDKDIPDYYFGICVVVAF